MLTPANIPVGSTVYCTGDFGDILFTSTTTKGSAGEGYVTFINCAGQSTPLADEIYFDTDFNAYLKFIHWDVNHTSDSNPGVAVLDGDVNYVQFEDCNFWWTYDEVGDFSAGDFAPYYIGIGGASKYSNFKSVWVDNGCSYWSFTNCNFEHGWRLLFLLGHNHTVTGCTFKRCGEDHINCGGIATDITISNNDFTDTWSYYSCYRYPGSTDANWANYVGWPITQEVTGASGLYVGQADGKIHLVADDVDHLPTTTTASNNNWVVDANQDAVFDVTGVGTNQHCDHVSIESSSASGITVERNYFHTGGGQAIKVGANGGSPGPVTVENNKIRWNRSGTYAILLEAGTDNQIINNTVIHTSLSTGGIRLYGINVTTLRNNIMTGGFKEAGTVDSDYNVWGGAFPAGSEAHGIPNALLSSGFFTDYANQDYTLIAGSGAIDLGDSNYAPATDYAGEARDANPDIGAYEFIPPPPGENHSPVWNAIGDKGVLENRLLTFVVSATDEDPDPLTYLCLNPPTGATFITDTFSWTPTYGQSGIYNLVFTVTDQIATVFAYSTVTVTNVPQGAIMK
jgi:hypothetical protein